MPINGEDVLERHNRMLEKQEQNNLTLNSLMADEIEAYQKQQKQHIREITLLQGQVEAYKYMIDKMYHDRIGD